MINDYDAIYRQDLVEGSYIMGTDTEDSNALVGADEVSGAGSVIAISSQLVLLLSLSM